MSFSLEEREKVTRASELSAPSVSAFIREAAVRRADRELAKAEKDSATEKATDKAAAAEAAA